MFITLNSLGGHKVRINTDKIIKYSLETTGIPLQDKDGYGTATALIVDQSPILYVKETPEQVDEILRTSYITVYDRK